MYRQTAKLGDQSAETSPVTADPSLPGIDIAAAPGSPVPAARPRRREAIKPNRKLGISIRPLEIRDFARAMLIAVTNFGSEIHLIALSYLWYFWQRAGLPDSGAMWGRRQVIARAPEFQTAVFDLASSFVHGRQVAWLDLSRLNGSSVQTALAAIRHWPLCHRLLVVRVHRSLMQPFLAAGFEMAGRLPDGEQQHCYLQAPRAEVRDPQGPKVTLTLGKRQSLSVQCEFSIVERNGKRVGLTGIYGVGLWRDVIWGAWGAMHPSCARRDAVFETLRQTEERARMEGAKWFCLETSDCEKFRHARKIYEIYGLELLLSIPNFYVDRKGGNGETLMVYGKPLIHPEPGVSRKAFDLVSA